MWGTRSVARKLVPGMLIVAVGAAVGVVTPVAALQAVTTWATDADGIVLRDLEGVTKVTLAPPH